MAIAVVFSPGSMTAAQYDEIIRQLDQAGVGTVKERLYHVCYGTGNQLRVLDVWESPESFEKFGATLMPILHGLGIDPGQLEVTPVHNTIQ